MCVSPPRDRLLHFLAEMLLPPCRMDYCLAMLSGAGPRTLPTAATPISGVRAVPDHCRCEPATTGATNKVGRKCEIGRLVRLGLFWANRIAEAKN